LKFQIVKKVWSSLIAQSPHQAPVLPGAQQTLRSKLAEFVHHIHKDVQGRPKAKQQRNALVGYATHVPAEQAVEAEQKRD